MSTAAAEEPVVEVWYDLAGEEKPLLRFPPTAQQPVARAVPRTGKRFSTPYITVFMPALLAIAHDRTLTLSDIRVWAAVLARATHEKPEWDVDAAGIGRDAGIHPKNVQKSIRKLVEKGLILRPRHGKLALPPSIAWRGSAQDREIALRKAREAVSGDTARPPAL